VPLREPSDAPVGLRHRTWERLELFVESYGATGDERADLIGALPHCHAWCYSVVQQAIASGHKFFSRQWRAGGRQRAERTSRWLATRSPEMRAVLGLPPS
jgi:hypothetical protein